MIQKMRVNSNSKNKKYYAKTENKACLLKGYYSIIEMRRAERMTNYALFLYISEHFSLER